MLIKFESRTVHCIMDNITVDACICEDCAYGVDVTQKGVLCVYEEHFINKQVRDGDKVAIRQYLRPNGELRWVVATVGKEHARKANRMVLSTEQLSTGKIAVYGRWPTELAEEETLELADNTSGKNGPTEALKRVIEKVYERKPELPE